MRTMFASIAVLLLLAAARPSEAGAAGAACAPKQTPFAKCMREFAGAGWDPQNCRGYYYGTRHPQARDVCRARARQARGLPPKGGRIVHRN